MIQKVHEDNTIEPIYGDIPSLPERVLNTDFFSAPAGYNAGPQRHPSSIRFHEILLELGELHDEKQKGYGKPGDPFANVRASADWGMPAWVGSMLRAGDKLKRLQAYLVSGELPFEAVEDAFRDLAVYAIIGLCLFEEEAAKV